MSEHIMQALFAPPWEPEMREAGKPYFLEIAEELTGAIASGRLPVGSLLPTEMALCGQYRTSRHTIRAALRELQGLGLVSRRKNVGTRVEARQSRNGFRPSLSSLEDLVQFGSVNLRSVQSVEQVEINAGTARLIGAPAGVRKLKISSLRIDSLSRTIVGWTDVYLDPDYAELGEAVRAEPQTLVSALIERLYGRSPAEVRQTVRAVAIAEPQASRLNVVAGSPGLQIVRLYLDAPGQIYEASVTIHPADRFELNMTLQRETL